MATSASIDKVQKLFIAFYQRPADVTGLEYWANRVDAANGDTSAVVNAFATSAEATALYPATLSTTQLVNNVYQALFGRAPDAAGLNFYANAIAAGTMTPGKLAQNILDGATGTDATIIANKLTVAKAYTAAMDTTAEILAYNGNNGNNALANAKALLTNVNALDTSVTNATNQIPAIMVNNVNNAAATITAPGTAFTFTAGIDSYTGTTNADSVSGAIADITAVDVVAGGAGAATAAVADTLTLTTAGALSFAAGAAGANVTGFEKLVLANGTNTITLGSVIEATNTVDGRWTNITGGTGTDTIVMSAGAQAINLTTVTGVEFFDTTTTAGGAVAFSGAAASGITVSGTGTGAITLGNFTNSITLAGASAKTVTGGTGTDTVTINGTVGANVVTVDAVENVTGHAGADVVTLAAASTTTVNISGVETVNGGTGAQTVNFGGSTTGVTYSHVMGTVAGGGGGLDTINLNAANAAVDTVKFAKPAATTTVDVVAEVAASMLTVNGFVATNDKITLEATDGANNGATSFYGTTMNTAAGATPSLQAVSATGALVLAATADITVLNFEMGGATNVLGGVSNGAALLSNLGGALTVATAGGAQNGYIVAYDAGNAYVYSYAAAVTTGDTAVTADEIALIGTFNGVAVGALSAANFVLA